MVEIIGCSWVTSQMRIRTHKLDNVLEKLRLAGFEITYLIQPEMNFINSAKSGDLSVLEIGVRRMISLAEMKELAEEIDKLIR